MDELFGFLKAMGIPGYNAKRLVDQARGFEDVALARAQELEGVPPDAGESKYTQLKQAFSEAFRMAVQERKAAEQEAAHTEMVRHYDRGRAKGIVPTKEQLEDMILKAYNSGEILDMAPRNIPKELREDPEALKAKVLEWGINGAGLLKDMLAAAQPEPMEDDIPF